MAAAAFFPRGVAGGAGGRSEGAVVSVLGAEVLGACCCVVYNITNNCYYYYYRTVLLLLII